VQQFQKSGRSGWETMLRKSLADNALAVWHDAAIKGMAVASPSPVDLHYSHLVTS
jgi:hypothetical protein